MQTFQDEQIFEQLENEEGVIFTQPLLPKRISFQTISISIRIYWKKKTMIPGNTAGEVFTERQKRKYKYNFIFYF